MALRERLKSTGQLNGTGPLGGPAEQVAVNGQNSMQEVKARLHRALINRMDLTKLNLLTPDQTHAEVARLAQELMAGEDVPLSAYEREQLIEDLRHELFGLGPIEPLLADQTIS